ncbi:HEXXH motif-containing putative peptide modification protein [uncultured Enterovirga sp.]|uniref:aKG-HExxH-type peptide beta-hydroxylase n=1 Tax=uncultured Enterovirga sp. TaxID=2026352 RepID=UPI0035C99639
MTDGAELVKEALATPGPCWFEGLAERLAGARYRKMELATGINRARYGTVRYLARDAWAARTELASVDFPADFEASIPATVELLGAPISKRYADLGLDLYGPSEIHPEEAVTAVLAAFRRIGEVPGAAVAIGALLSALHVLRPEGPEYDVSYSDPAVPFTIFVGIHPRAGAYGDLRLAESILHECMHLQLTLMESVAPIVVDGGERMHSPWQGTSRPILGILHGLYVFRAIQNFHRALLNRGAMTSDECRYLERRIDVIENEAQSVQGLTGSRDLTAVGQRLASRLLLSR